MKLFTIGFTKKSAERFFNLLSSVNVKRIVDIRPGVGGDRRLGAIRHLMRSQTAAVAVIADRFAQTHAPGNLVTVERTAKGRVRAQRDAGAFSLVFWAKKRHWTILRLTQPFVFGTCSEWV